MYQIQRLRLQRCSFCISFITKPIADFMIALMIFHCKPYAFENKGKRYKLTCTCMDYGAALTTLSGPFFI